MTGLKSPLRFPALPEFAGKELLTPRERQVLYYLIHTTTSKYAARKLGISFRTVENHALRIYEKLLPKYEFESKKLVRLMRLVYSLDEIDKLIELGHQQRRYRGNPPSKQVSHIHADC